MYNTIIEDFTSNLFFNKIVEYIFIVQKLDISFWNQFKNLDLSDFSSKFSII